MDSFIPEMKTSKIEPLLALVNLDLTTNTSTTIAQKSKLSFGIFVKSYSQVNSDISNPYLFGVLLVRCRKDTNFVIQ